MNPLTAPHLDELYRLLIERAAADPQESYTASLISKGIDRILKKVGEESVEVLLAAKGDDRGALVGEVADLLYHLLVMLVSKGIPLDEIWSELERRTGVSGLEEKASRTTGS